MLKWLIENKDLFIPFATLLCAAFGGWWAGKKRVGIEVLSKNRQEWINELRSKISEFLSISEHSFELYSYYNELQHSNEKNENLRTLYAIHNYLKLLLNSNENKSNKILESCNNLILFLSSAAVAEPPLTALKADDWSKRYDSKFFNLKNELVEKTQNVLKEEWERVKKGV